MRVIDLLVKIANKEEIPNFKVGYDKYYVSSDWTIKDANGKNAEWYIYEGWLNEEVEIIEEKPKKIEKIDEWKFNKSEDDIPHFELANKINEIIDYLLEKESDK